MSTLILVRFSCTSISFIAIVLLRIERDPRKHINISLIKVELIFFLFHDVAAYFGKSLFIVNNSLSFESKDLHAIPIAPCIANISGVKLACSLIHCKTLYTTVV